MTAGRGGQVMVSVGSGTSGTGGLVSILAGRSEFLTGGALVFHTGDGAMASAVQ